MPTKAWGELRNHHRRGGVGRLAVLQPHGDPKMSLAATLPSVDPRIHRWRGQSFGLQLEVELRLASVCAYYRDWTRQESIQEFHRLPR